MLQPSAGMKITWSASAPACAKIVDVTFTPTDLGATPPAVTGAPQVIVKNGVVQDPARTYRVTVNSFMASGGDGFRMLAEGTSRVGGAQDIDAMTAYLAPYATPQAPYDEGLPALGEPRIERRP